jgi:hypothetical protein
MKKIWLTFAVVVIIGTAYFSMPYEQRQGVAKYVVFCFLIAGFIGPAGLAIGKFLSKFLNKN